MFLIPILPQPPPPHSKTMFPITNTTVKGVLHGVSKRTKCLNQNILSFLKLFQ